MDVTVTARKSLYIRGLQAAHAGVLEVIDNAFHVAMYEFFPEKSKWERMDIEGSVYLTRNNSSPLYSLIILNKKGPTDLVMHVEENIEKMRIQEQYIMIRCRKGDESNVSIVGLWIHDAIDRERFFRSVIRIKEIRKNSPDVSTLFGKFIQRSPSSGNVNSAIEASSTTTLSKLTMKDQVDSSTTTDIASSQMQVIVTSPTEGNNASVALLNILKSVSKKGSDEKVDAAKSCSIASAGTSSGNASLDDIIKKPDSVKSSGASPTKLTSTLKGLLASTSNTSVDFPTDGQISAKAKSRQVQQKDPLSDSSDSSLLESSSPIATFQSLSTDSTLVSEQLSIDSVVSTTSSAPSSVSVSTDALKVLLSIGQGKIPSRSISDPITLPEKSSVSGLVSLDASSSTSSSTSPVTVTSLRETLVSSLSSEGYLSPKRLFPEYGSKQMGLSSMSAKKVAKLISPADLGEVV